MRIEIAIDTCLNSGQCAFLQPDLFDVDDEGVPSILVTGELAEEQVPGAQQAVDTCPSGSIRLIE